MRDIIATGTTRFDPNAHGFHFSNLRLRWRSGPIEGTALCGGMSYGSLDYYYHSVPVPADRTPPALGTELNTYLTDRQVHAHGFMARTLPVRALASGAGQFRSGLSLDGYFGGVVRSIDGGKPVPILMMSLNNPVSTESHWTVAIGYEMDEAPPDYGGRRCGRVILYDNNYPDRTSTLTPNFERQCFDHDQGAQYRTYWPNTDYRSRDPRWRPTERPASSSWPTY